MRVEFRGEEFCLPITDNNGVFVCVKGERWEGCKGWLENLINYKSCLRPEFYFAYFMTQELKEGFGIYFKKAVMEPPMGMGFSGLGIVLASPSRTKFDEFVIFIEEKSVRCVEYKKLVKEKLKTP